MSPQLRYLAFETIARETSRDPRAQIGPAVLLYAYSLD